jgi:hypothetical protein
MNRDITQLVNALKVFPPAGTTKQAGADSVSDPAVCGAPAISGDAATEPHGTNGDGIAATLPGVSPGMQSPMVEQGAGPNAPAAKPFVESGKMANIDILRQKMAAIATGSTSAPAPAATSEEVTSKEAAAPQVAPLGYHLVFNSMLKSAKGREAIEDALSEIHGVEKAAHMVKQSLAEQEEFETSYLRDQLEAIEHQKLAYAAQQEHDRQAEHLQTMLKQASTPEQHKAITDSYFLLKSAEARFIDHEVAHADFSAGAVIGEKVAAAMMEDPALMEDPSQMEELQEPGGEPSPEEILAALEELVASGELTPEQAQQIAEALFGGMEGAMPPGAEGGMPPGMEGMPPKEASALVSESAKHLQSVATFVESVTAA